MTDTRPPGEPPAEALADHLSDVVVVDGPRAGEVWTYEADHGGYLPADPARRQDDDTPIADIGALLLHVQAQVVRPVPDGYGEWCSEHGEEMQDHDHEDKE